MYDLLESEEKLAFLPRSNIKNFYCNFLSQDFFHGIVRYKLTIASYKVRIARLKVSITFFIF